MVKRFISALLAGLLYGLSVCHACTTITLQGEGGTVVVGRTMEWAEFDLQPQLVIVPRGYAMGVVDKMPDGKEGARWKAKYGFVGIDVLDTLSFMDAMNEKRLVVETLYLPGFAEYQKYDPGKAGNSIGPMDVAGWIVSQFATTDEVRRALPSIRVVPVTMDVLGMPAPVHFLVTDANKRQIAVEYVRGTLEIHDAPLGVMTNSPAYDWHITNLRNHINLKATSLPDVKVADIDLEPIGVGSGMLGLPGDFTSPSRFVRATAFSQTARKTEGGFDTVRELFRILDNFNVPIEAVTTDQLPKGTGPIRYSGTQYTTAWDMRNMALYYHTDTDRSIRKVDVKKMDFGKLGDKPVRQPLRFDEEKAVRDVTPGD